MKKENERNKKGASNGTRTKINRRSKKSYYSDVHEYGELQYENGSKNRISAFGEADTLLYEFIEYMYKEI